MLFKSVRFMREGVPEDCPVRFQHTLKSPAHLLIQAAVIQVVAFIGEFDNDDDILFRHLPEVPGVFVKDIFCVIVIIYNNEGSDN